MHPEMGCLARLLCLPLALAMLAAAGWWLWRMAPQLPHTLESLPLMLRCVCGGLAAGVILFSFLPLSPIYVLGHEVTHWIVAKIFRRHTGAMHLGWHSGSVEVTEPNACIVLAPYCVPFYFVLALGGIAFCSLWMKMTTHFQVVAGGVMGLSYAYHLVLTFQALRRSQADMKHCGWLLSMVLILGCNLLLVDLLVFFVVRVSAP